MRIRAKVSALAAIVLLALSAMPALAVRPDEVLADPALETRARAISENLRCLVCQNQSIDDSEADLARDLRILVRERLKAGDTDKQVVDFVVSRYGEFVLLKPRFSARNALLWGAPALLLFAGAIVLVMGARKRRRKPQEALSAEEQVELEKILHERD